MFNAINRINSFRCLLLIVCSVQLLSCDTINLYEKVVPIPEHQWKHSFKPQFTFQVQDTVAPYEAFIILRHNNKYKYNNIWINLYGKAPSDSAHKLGLELPLANKEGWLGTGMDDIFEHRIRIGGEIEKLPFVRMDDGSFYFSKPGDYTFTLEQIMRDDPLADVMNVGFRLEKKTP